jgi:hypothetical protein
MATAEWARSLNDPTLNHAYDRALQRRGQAQADLDQAQRDVEVLSAEYRHRRELAAPADAATTG